MAAALAERFDGAMNLGPSGSHKRRADFAEGRAHARWYRPAFEEFLTEVLPMAHRGEFCTLPFDDLLERMVRIGNSIRGVGALAAYDVAAAIFFCKCDVPGCKSVFPFPDPFPDPAPTPDPRPPVCVARGALRGVRIVNALLELIGLPTVTIHTRRFSRVKPSMKEFCYVERLEIIRAFYTIEEQLADEHPDLARFQGVYAFDHSIIREDNHNSDTIETELCRWEQAPNAGAIIGDMLNIP